MCTLKSTELFYKYVYYVLWNQKVTGGPISMGVSYQGMTHPQIKPQSITIWPPLIPMISQWLYVQYV